MLNLGVIPVDVTARFYFSTAAADGGEENFSATIEQADITVMKDGTAMTLSASTITITNIATGLYEVDIDQTNDSDFTAGSTYWVLLDASDETIDSQAVSAVLGCWTTESASQRAMRMFFEKRFPGHLIATTTSNSTTAINLTDVVDAQTPDDSMIGEILTVWDATDGKIFDVIVTDLTSLVAAVVMAKDGSSAMPITVAAGDMVWRNGHTAANLVRAGNVASGAWSATRGLAGTALPAAAADAAGGLPVSDAGGLDLDAKIGALTFTQAGAVDANVTHVNETEVTGDGSEGTEWGPAA